MIELLVDRLLRVASRVVPPWRRVDWEREWRAELDCYAADELRGWRRLVRAAGAFADALWLRIQGFEIGLWTGELRFACRRLARRPAFTLLVVLTLAVGAGVGGAVFAMVDAVFLRPLPYKDPSRLVFLWQTLPADNIFEVEATPFDYQVWREAKSFSAVALVSADTFTLTGNDDPERLHGSRVTASLFPLLGVAPRIGRAFDPAEDSAMAPPVVILGDGVWRRRFSSDAGVIGRVVEVDGVPTTIVGVMPPATFLPGPLAGDDEVWLPTRMTPAERDNRVAHSYTILGRLSDGVSLQRASAEMTALAASTAAAHPDTHKSLGAHLVPVPEQTVREIRPAMAVLVAGVALLVAIASGNVIALLLAEASSRRQELAVRAALGAGYGRLACLAVAETVVIAALGGLAGVTLADWVLRALLPAFSDALPRSVHIALDARVAMTTMAASILLGVAFGLVVAAHKPAERFGDALRSGGRAGSSRDVARTRDVLVVAQIALAVILLAGSGVLVRSFVRLSRVQPGFRPDHVLTFRIALPDAAYPAPPMTAAFVRDAIARLAAVPGVLSAAANTHIPFGRGRGANGFIVEGRPVAPADLQIADQRDVTPQYFQTMGMRVVDGRGFTDRDDDRGEPVAIVNETMARRFWPGGTPIDGRIRVMAGEEASGWLRIVGIVNDVHHIDLSRAPVPEMYRPFAQISLRNFTVLLRTSGDPASVAPGARTAIGALDRRLPLYDMRTMEARIADSVAKTRALAFLLLATAIVAASMAAIALYGSIWYSVTQRIPEIGVRVALGATRRSVCALVVKRAATTTAVGAALGLAASAAAAPLLGQMLFETKPVDPWTYAIVALVLAGLTVAASLVPARRAMRVDPLTALRQL
jgi:putative ABC transport system permease protein